MEAKAQLKIFEVSAVRCNLCVALSVIVYEMCFIAFTVYMLMCEMVWLLSLWVLCLQEIEDVKRHPPQHCEVINFGNTPVTATFRVCGPPDSAIYCGSTLELQLIFYDGYPYRAPDVKILSRVFHVNAITQLDGGARLLHMRDTWSADWSISRLLTHLVQLLRAPDISLLPEELAKIYRGWSAKLYGELLPKNPKYVEAAALRDSKRGAFSADAADSKESGSRPVSGTAASSAKSSPRGGDKERMSFVDATAGSGREDETEVKSSPRAADG